MTKKIIEIKNLDRKFGNKKVLDSASMNVEEGSIYGLLGPNGVGKTTILKVISGIIKKDSGNIKLFGEEFTLKHLEDIGVLIDHPILYENLSAYDNMKTHSLLSGISPNKKIFNEILDLLGLEEEARKRKVKGYSLGMKQRLAIGIALVGNPKILILDEPLNGIDIEGVIEFREVLKKLQKKGITIIISSHILSEIEKTCTHIGIFNKGKMKFEGTKKELLELGGDVEENYLNFIKK